MAHPLVIGLLGGTGPQGRGLALRFALAGHEVLLGSRDAERARRVTEELLAGRDLPIRGVANQEAAARADAVALVFPYAGQASTLPLLEADIGSKVVVSLINPLAFDQQGPHLLDVPEGSAAEQAQRLLPRARVVAAFHHAPPKLLADPAREVETDVLVAGDDPDAKSLVIGLADGIPGCRGIDVGPLRQARWLEGFTAVIIAVNKRYRIHSGVRITRLPEERRRAVAHAAGGPGASK